MLYSVYSFPNIILPFLGGFLLDKIGVRYGIFIFTLVLIIGQFGKISYFILFNYSISKCLCWEGIKRIMI